MDSEQLQTYGCGYLGCSFVLTIIVFIAGWVMYGSLGGGFWILLIWLALGLTSLIGLVPIAGPFLYWKLATVNVLPPLLNAAGLTATWLTTAILWLGLFSSVVLTIVGIVIAIVILAAIFS